LKKYNQEAQTGVLKQFNKEVDDHRSFIITNIETFTLID
jgi:hypothetical protein